eukprot:TRINITY_DN9120_c0_g1_i2.p1 TRINITY_DN9120_c0_g1~~TRINITY_DN9120_c0_g1_i2.p1  ORF type:complete len:403 (+),score=79.89 TRINITY_DN9120_c0_g1_i2:73-1281(+)
MRPRGVPRALILVVVVTLLLLCFWADRFSRALQRPVVSRPASDASLNPVLHREPAVQEAEAVPKVSRQSADRRVEPDVVLRQEDAVKHEEHAVGDGEIAEVSQDSMESAHKQQPGSTPEGFEFVASIARNKTILIIPVNGGWHELGVNLWCSLQKVTKGLRSEMTFLAFDDTAFRSLRRLSLPVYMDPLISIQAEGAKEWGSAKFNSIVCSKLSAVLHLQRRGYTVVLVDADVVALADPLAHLPDGPDVVWSWGGHYDPTGTPPAKSKRPPSCHEPFTLGRCYVNTGFYVVRPTAAAIALFERGERECFSGRPTVLGDKDDQTYMNEILKAEEGTPKANYQTACFNPCTHTNGNTFFKYHLPEKLGGTGVTVHANFMTGGAKKRGKFQAHGLWDVGCAAAAA